MNEPLSKPLLAVGGSLSIVGFAIAVY